MHKPQKRYILYVIKNHLKEKIYKDNIYKRDGFTKQN